MKGILSFIAVFLLILTILISCKEDDNQCIVVNKENCICTEIYDPVCGCNNVTYSNECEALCASITEYTDGACKDDNQCIVVNKDNCLCTEVFDPVCGCNNVTYGNKCKALCASITEYTDGACD